ncbi:MotA/TolQ/ExbB proton channel family protein [Rugamonas sp. CCM 8940]|uniref:MotA/TolQ/ExbB proton channel family protein n=1 Tax=Rugamonas sp. CCM 8940 TaxID=2765359 RepID=UPI0018F3B7C4|nr:MotA/TolQ/ExbB proton channel family protein [Rugamonas sp. CCM 8940]MBJ7312563.1 MotA/TolQ/ExbB proton channel family protein [Rugamonas sp. CCM 8940]
MKIALRFFTLSATAAAATSAQAQDMVGQLAHGGVGIIVIGVMSLLTLAVAIERLLHLRNNRIAPDALLEEALALWRAGQFEELQARVADADSTLARMIVYLLARRGAAPAAAGEGAAALASLELRAHQHKAYLLGAVATIAPIVGLLGTVIGMIESFHVIAFSGAMGDPALLAGGISKALINTAAGLALALPALCLHHYFKNRVAALGLALEQAIQRLQAAAEAFERGGAQGMVLQAVPHAH